MSFSLLPSPRLTRFRVNGSHEAMLARAANDEKLMPTHNQRQVNLSHNRHNLNIEGVFCCTQAIGNANGNITSVLHAEERDIDIHIVLGVDAYIITTPIAHHRDFPLQFPTITFGIHGVCT